MLVLTLTTVLLSVVDPACDVHLQGAPSAIRTLARDLRAEGLDVSTEGPCPLHVSVERFERAWTLHRESTGRPDPETRIVSTRAEASFVILAWVFEDVVDPLIAAPASPQPAPRTDGSPSSQAGPPPPRGSGTKAPPTEPGPSAPQPRVAAVERRSLEVSGAPERPSVRSPAQSEGSPWSVRSEFWVGVDDGAEPWTGGAVGLHYRFDGFEAVVWLRAGTSHGARANPLATRTRRTSVDVLFGGGPLLRFWQLHLRPRVAVGVGALRVRREGVSDDCLQPGACDIDAHHIPDDFTAVGWVPKATLSAEARVRLAGPLRLTMDLGVTFAPEQDFVPNYAAELSAPVQRRTALAGIPWIIAHGGLGLALEIP